MLTRSELKNPGKKRGRGAGNVAKYLFETEYYVGKDGVAKSQNCWLGKGAEALGLTGEVDQKAFARLLDGYGPSGQKLAQNAGRGDRLLGHDLTFSADKTLSLLFIEASPEEREKLMAAHHAAAEKALEYVQEQMTARRGHAGKGEGVAVVGLAIARFDHFSTRAGDPDLHSHYVVANAALGADGKWSTFDGMAIKAHCKAAGALYRAELAQAVKGLAYGVESRRVLDNAGRETGEVWHKVAGVGDDESRYFSKRREEIEAYMDEHGVSAQEANMRTRKAKERGEPPLEQTLAENRREMQRLRAEGVVTWQSAEDLKGRASVGLAPSTDAEILRRLHAQEAIFSKADLLERLAKDRGDSMGADALRAEAADFLTRAGIVRLRDDEHGRERYASQAHIDLEKSIGERAAARKDDTSVRVAPARVDEAIAEHEQAKGFTLTDEQRKAVQFVAAESGGVACLRGEAGTGKTATAGAYIRAFEANGQRVLGVAQAWKAANKLSEETGLECASIASLLSELDSQREKLDSKSVLLVDEAGMIGAESLARLQQHTDEAGAKLVLIGDPLQLQPVEASAGFTLAMRETGEARQTEIRRQKQESDRELARAFYGRETGAALVKGLEKRGQLRTEWTQADARKALIFDYLRDTRPAHEKLVIAGTNAQATAITGEIRRGLKARGELSGGVLVEVAGRLQGETREIELAPGDRVRFTRRDKALGVVNGDAGFVESVGVASGGHVLQIRLMDDGKPGKTVTLDTGAYRSLAYDYAGTVYKAQGQGKESVFWLADGTQDRSTGLVAYTRQKEQMRGYVSEQGRDKLISALEDFRLKTNAVDLLREDDTGPVPTQARPGLAHRVREAVRQRVHALRAPKPTPEPKPERKAQEEPQAKPQRQAGTGDALAQARQRLEARREQLRAVDALIATMREKQQSEEAKDRAWRQEEEERWAGALAVDKKFRAACDARDSAALAAQGAPQALDEAKTRRNKGWKKNQEIQAQIAAWQQQEPAIFKGSWKTKLEALRQQRTANGERWKAATAEVKNLEGLVEAKTETEKAAATLAPAYKQAISSLHRWNAVCAGTWTRQTEEAAKQEQKRQAEEQARLQEQAQQQEQARRQGQGRGQGYKPPTLEPRGMGISR